MSIHIENMLLLSGLILLLEKEFGKPGAAHGLRELRDQITTGK